MRTNLLGDGYHSVGDISETHQCAEATLKKNQELRKAFNIRDDYVDGSVFGKIGKPEGAASSEAKPGNEGES